MDRSDRDQVTHLSGLAWRALAAGAVLALVSACSAGSNPPTARPSAAASAVSVPTTRPCTADSLGTHFRGGGRATGFIAATIEVWNSGSTPCRLDGTVAFTALAADGTPDPDAKARTLPRLAVTMPPGITTPPDATGSPGYLFAYLAGFFRDDEQQPDDLCRAQDEVTPETLVLSIGDLTLRVPNRATAAPDPTSPPILQAVYGCHGNVALEQVRGP
jgi:hypothetical protein